MPFERINNWKNLKLDYQNHKEEFKDDPNRYGCFLMAHKLSYYKEKKKENTIKRVVVLKQNGSYGATYNNYSTIYGPLQVD